MSYNYLPLDRKWINFQQVKNLLDYGQLVSITFDAHERILKCREYIDSKNIDNSVYCLSLFKNSDPDKQGETKDDNEVDKDIMKLVLMLKIKSLGSGNSGVEIETVKRLMEMYNNDVFPVIYTNSAVIVSNEVAEIAALALSLMGEGQVFYKGEKMPASHVFEELNWEPLKLQNYEKLALATGTHFITASGLYILKRVEQLLQAADAVAALSFNAIDCSVQALNAQIYTIRQQEAAATTAACILTYVNRSTGELKNSARMVAPNSFNSTPEVHGAAKETFEHVLAIFLKEMNSVTESVAIFPDDELVVNAGTSTGFHLMLALDHLDAAITGLANLSERRTNELVPPAVKDEALAKKTQAEIRALVSAVNKAPSKDSSFDTIVNSPDAFAHTLELVKILEKILAIELLTLMSVIEEPKMKETSASLQMFYGDSLRIIATAVDWDSSNQLPTAVKFIRTYKF